MSRAGQSILRGAREALAYSRGEREGFIAHVPGSREASAADHGERGSREPQRIRGVGSQGELGGRAGRSRVRLPRSGCGEAI